MVTQGNTHARDFVKTDHSVPCEKYKQSNPDTWQELRLTWAKWFIMRIRYRKECASENTKVKIYGKTGTAENPHGERPHEYWLDEL